MYIEKRTLKQWLKLDCIPPTKKYVRNMTMYDKLYIDIFYMIYLHANDYYLNLSVGGNELHDKRLNDAAIIATKDIISNILIQCEKHLLYFDRLGSCVVTETTASIQTTHLTIVNKYFENNENDIIKSFSQRIEKQSELPMQWELDFNLNSFYTKVREKFMSLLNGMRISDINYYYFKLFYDGNVKCQGHNVQNFRIGMDLEPRLITYG